MTTRSRERLRFFSSVPMKSMEGYPLITGMSILMSPPLRVGYVCAEGYVRLPASRLRFRKNVTHPFSKRFVENDDGFSRSV